jgi:hypothetical protein
MEVYLIYLVIRVILSMLLLQEAEKKLSQARLAQSVERETFNLKAKGSSPLSGEFFFSFISFQSSWN